MVDEYIDGEGKFELESQGRREIQRVETAEEIDTSRDWSIYRKGVVSESYNLFRGHK
jgi:hypothetical protein